MSTHLIYVLRPDNTALWLPAKMITALGLKKGERMTEAQFNSGAVQELLQRRLAKKGDTPAE
jgi:hypothetical protein